MENIRSLVVAGKLLVVVAILVWFNSQSVPAEAQTGDNAICTAQSGCLQTAASPAFIDASMFAVRL
jgi:hypothetical protein